MSRAQTLQKLKLYRKNPELYKEIAPTELADLVYLVLFQVESIEKAIKEGRLDGRTPQPDKDYMSNASARRMLTDAIKEMFAEGDAKIAEKARELDTKVQEVIQRIRDGEDGIVSDEEIERAAQIAFELIELPDFDALIEERITANPAIVRNSLEITQEEDDKLDQSAIKNLKEDLLQLQQQISNVYMAASAGTIGKQQVYGFINQAINDGTITGGSVNVETPSGTINGSNTDFTVANEPKYVVVNAFTYFVGAGYEYSGGTVTFDIPPATNSTIRSIY